MSTVTAESAVTSLRELPPRLRESIEPNQNRFDVDLIARAYRLSAKAHQGQKRASGEEYIAHCVEVAKILADLHLAAWATLLLRLEMEGMTRLVFFWGIGIVFPVLSAAGTLGVPGRLLQPLTDASLHLGTAATRAPSALFLGAAPVAALLLANVLPTRWFRT